MARGAAQPASNPWGTHEVSGFLGNAVGKGELDYLDKRGFLKPIAYRYGAEDVPSGQRDKHEEKLRAGCEKQGLPEPDLHPERLYGFEQLNRLKVLLCISDLLRVGSGLRNRAWKKAHRVLQRAEALCGGALPACDRLLYVEGEIYLILDADRIESMTSAQRAFPWVALAHPKSNIVRIASLVSDCAQRAEAASA